MKSLIVRVGLVSACSLALVACSGGSNDDRNAPPTTKTVDMSKGGECVDDQNVTITANNVTPTITGDCGIVTISGSNVDGRVADADNVIITGDNATMTGTEWDMLDIHAANVVVNVDELDNVRVNGNNAQVTSREIDNLTIDGARVTVNATSIDSVTVNSDDSSIVATGAITSLVVHGDRNSFKWSGGASTPSIDNGKDNTFRRQ